MTLGAQIKQEKGPRLYAVLINRLNRSYLSGVVIFRSRGHRWFGYRFHGLVGELPAAERALRIER